MSSKGRIVVFGILFWFPLAGVTWQFLHYLLGLRRLGYDPWYVEDSGRWIYDPVINDVSPDASRNIAAVAPVLERHGFGERWCFRGNYPGGRCYGLSEGQLLRLYRDADALLNVTGAQELRDEHMACRRRIYVESDPFAAQVRVAQGDAKTLAQLDAHDTHFSFGEKLGAADCAVPVERYTWLPTRQPVATDLWENPHPPGAGRYTTITSWKSDDKSKHVEFNGERYYWSKEREFEKVLDLPQRTRASFELAVSADEATTSRLAALGWNPRSSLQVSRDTDAYRDFIQRSRGEFTVARDHVTRPNTGWFSDRSACYLAAGRPVITEETGFSGILPAGEGLFGFRSMDDILAAIAAIEADHARHCHAARQIAVEYFEATRVLADLLRRAGL
jgi:hypothetical protein